MCPACVASAALVVGGVTTTGGLSALLVKILRMKKGNNQPQLAESEKEKQSWQQR